MSRPRLFFIILIIYCFSSLNAKSAGLEGKWKLVAIQRADSVIDLSYSNDEGCSIEFLSDSTYALFLSVNGGHGKYLCQDNIISIENAFLTKKCCDTRKADEFYSLLKNTKTFLLENGSLKLFQKEGALHLERIKVKKNPIIICK